MSKYDDSHSRDKALYLSWLAEAYLDAGEVEHAALVTSRALDLSANVSSARPQQRLTVLKERLRPHEASIREVRDLLARDSLNPGKIRG